MKAQAWLGLACLVAARSVSAESVFVPQATSVLQKHQLEVGVGGQFGYQYSEIKASPGTSYKNRVWHFPILARYGITETIESKLIIPITSAKDSSEGTTSTRYVDTGIGNIQIGSKWNFLQGRIPLAAALDLDLPTANSRNNPASLGWRYSTQVQQGFNTHLQLVADIPLIENRLKGHTQVGYMNTATYTTAAKSRFNPSDLFTFGASVDLNLDDKLKGISVSGECVGNSALNHSKSGSTRNGSDKGTVLEAGPSLRYQTGPIRTWTGLLIDAGPATYRSYNYRVHFGASYLFGGSR